MSAVAVRQSGGSSLGTADRDIAETKSVENAAALPDLKSSSMAVDLSKPLPTSLQADFVPDDILFALTQPPPAKDKLGPPTRHRNLETSDMQARSRPENIWSHKRREKFEHLIKQTPCVCGAGRDISFLYDVPRTPEPEPRPDKMDKSQIRLEAISGERKRMALPDTLVPEEYHIIRNKGVLGIEYYEDKYCLKPEDHEQHLVAFPSLRPNKRVEVKQLKNALDDMLEKAGINDTSVEFKGPTQIHNVLELIKKEQNIYNIIFHEIIRQVSVECVERGELLSELRKRYSDLLSKIPQQIKSLHEEVMAQRALDRRLTEELIRFKNTISVLTGELSEVKEHDKKISKEAQMSQENLKAALAEAQKNAGLLAEYHDLYELQRKRLERSVFRLTEERDIWSTAAYSLALKVTEESKLVTAKRLHLNEKAWAKLANHFTVLLSDTDTEALTTIQTHVEKWRDLLEDFDFFLRHKEAEILNSLEAIKGEMQELIADFKAHCFNSDGQFTELPGMEQIQFYLSSLQKYSQKLSQIYEVFGGEMLLSSLNKIKEIQQQMDKWTDDAIEIFNRHQSLESRRHPEHDRMIILNEIILFLDAATQRPDLDADIKNKVRAPAQAEYLITLSQSRPGAGNLFGTNWTMEEAVKSVYGHLDETDISHLSPVLRSTVKRWTGSGSDLSSDNSSLASLAEVIPLAPPPSSPDIFSREFMEELHKEVGQLLNNIHTRITGENGVAHGLMHLSHSVDIWEAGLKAAVSQAIVIKDTEWSIFYLMLDEWSANIDKVSGFVGSSEMLFASDAEKSKNKLLKSPTVFDCVKKVQKWISTTSNAIDSEDAKMMEMVSSMHAEMVRWMVQMLLRLVPDMRDNSPEAQDLALLGSCSVPQLLQNALSIFDRLTTFTQYIHQCCNSIVKENTQRRLDFMEDHADHELKEFTRMQTECDQWVRNAKLLLVSLTGDPMEVLFPTEPVIPIVPSASCTDDSSLIPSDGTLEQDLDFPEGAIPSGTAVTEQVFQDKPEPAVTENIEIYMSDRTSDAQEGIAPEIPKEQIEEAHQVAPEVTVQKEDKTPKTLAAEKKRDSEISAHSQLSMASQTSKVSEISADRESPFQAPETFEHIGKDDNTHTAVLDVTSQTAPVQLQPSSLAVQIGALDTKKSFEALAAVSNLQTQLLSTEERAQKAEERAREAEFSINRLNEKIRALERRVAQFEAADTAAPPQSPIPSGSEAPTSSLPMTKSRASLSPSPSTERRRSFIKPKKKGKKE